MGEILARLAQGAGSLGGGLALAFIVAMAAFLVLLALLFAGAAWVVLDRFARRARFGVAPVAAAALWSAALAALALHSPGEREVAAQAGAGMLVLATFVTTALATGLLGVAMRRLRTAALAGSLLASFAIGTAAIAAARSGLGGAFLLRAGGLLAGLPFALAAFGLVPLAAAGFVQARRSAEWFIAARYLVARRRQTFISVITAICIGGVASGVWLIITVLSVMNGFERTWRDEIIGNRAHFTVQSATGAFGDYERILERVLATPGVVAASPYLDAEGMVRGEGRGPIVGIRIRGIDPKRVGQVTDLRKDLVEGSLDDLAPGGPQGGANAPPGIVVGSQLASVFGLRVGDPLLVISPFGGPPTPFGPAPRLTRFRVVGIFRSSFFQYDEVFTYVGLHAAQAFRRVGDVVDGIEVRTTDFYRSRRVAAQVQRALGYPFYTRDWKEYFPAFFQALKTERVMMFVLLTMIMVVAAFAIVVTLIMMIMEKASDVAILKAMGAEDEAVERIFAIEGTLIGLVGTVLGVAIGIVVTTRLDWIQHQVERVLGIDVLPASVYQLSTLPWQFDPLQIAAVAGIAMALSLGATLLPSRQAARLDPAEALRYE